MKYKPHDYQAYAIDYIETHPVAAVLLDMGLGKTSITLTAIFDLLFDSFEVHRVLVIAPLRVARDTWTAEVDKWDHLQSLICSVAVGTETERKAALTAPFHLSIHFFDGHTFEAQWENRRKMPKHSEERKQHMREVMIQKWRERHGESNDHSGDDQPIYGSTD